jgi:hypothetical protein
VAKSCSGSGIHHNARRPIAYTIRDTFAAMGYEIVREILQLPFFAFTILVYLISRGPIATTFAILAFISDSAGYVLEVVEPSNLSLLLGYTGSISATS